MRVTFTVVLFLFVTCVANAQNNVTHQQLVAGAGTSTEVTKLFFKQFNQQPSAQGFSFLVMPSSVKHQGGIMASDSFLFGHTGRPLSREEKQRGKAEIFLGKVPIRFITGLETHVKQITLQQLKDIFTNHITNWAELNGENAPILLVGREPDEALFLNLKQAFPFFAHVQFDKVFMRDADVKAFLKTPKGAHAIAFGAKPNFSSHFLLNVKEFDCCVPVGLVYDLKNSHHPMIKAVSSYAKSSEWKHQLQTNDMQQVN